MYSVSVDIIGEEETRKWLLSLSPEVEDEIQRNLMKLAQPVVQEAKKLAPVKTGRLKASIAARLAGWLQVMVKDGVPYGIYQEIGFYHWISGKWIQNPFLFPAIQIKTPEIIKNLRFIVNNYLKRKKKS